MIAAVAEKMVRIMGERPRTRSSCAKKTSRDSEMAWREAPAQPRRAEAHISSDMEVSRCDVIHVVTSGPKPEIKVKFGTNEGRQNLMLLMRDPKRSIYSVISTCERPRTS